MSSGRSPYSLQDVINAARTSPNFDYSFWFSVLAQIIVQESFKCLGYLLVIIATGIITALGYCGLIYILPYYSPVFSLSYFFNSSIGIFILFNIYYNYFYAVITPPGSPDKDLYSIDSDPSSNSNSLESSFPSSSSLSERLKQCKKCNVLKPPRAHHCSMCERCTLRMDHHCPWVNNCVGLQNYRFFVLFLFWTTFGTLYLTVLSLPPTVTIVQHEISQSNDFSSLSFSSLFSFNSLSSSTNSTSSSSSSSSSSLNDMNLYQLWDTMNKKQEDWVENRKKSLRGSLLNNDISNSNSLNSNSNSHRKLIERHSNLSPNDFNSNTLLKNDPSSSSPSSSSSSSSSSLETLSVWSLLVLFLRPRLFSDVLNELDSSTLPIMVTFLTSIAVHIAVLMLFLFHAFLVSTGQTTIEFYINMNRRPMYHHNHNNQNSNNQNQNINIHQCNNEQCNHNHTSTNMNNTNLNNNINGNGNMNNHQNQNGQRQSYPMHPYDRGVINNIQEIFGPYPWYIAILPFTRPPIQSNLWMNEQNPLNSRGHGYVGGRKRADTGYGSLLDV